MQPIVKRFRGAPQCCVNMEPTPMGLRQVSRHNSMELTENAPFIPLSQALWGSYHPFVNIP